MSRTYLYSRSDNEFHFSTLDHEKAFNSNSNSNSNHNHNHIQI